MSWWYANGAAGGRSRRAATVGALAGLAGLLVILPACSESGSGKRAVELAFKGRCADAKGQGIPAFLLSVGHPGIPLRPVTVTTTSGQYETRLSMAMPAAATPDRILGPHTEKITIHVSAKGYKSKTFTVTADQIFVGKANTLNVTLEPAS